MFRKLLLTAPLVAAALAAPAAADAATIVGEIAPIGYKAKAQQGSIHFAPSAADAIPADGVITHWATRNGQFLPAGNSARLVVMRQDGSTTTFRSVATASWVPLHYQSNGGDVRIRVKAGDRVGIELNTPGGDTAGWYAKTGYKAAITSGVGELGQPFSKGPGGWQWIEQTGRPNVSAAVEPDADGDGFGDESQDGCKGAAGAEGGCPPAPPAPPVLPVAPTTSTPTTTTTPSVVPPVTPRASVPSVSSAAPRLTIARPAVRGRRVTLRVVAPKNAKLVITAKTKSGRKALRRPKRLTLAAGRATRVKLTLNKAARRGSRVTVTLTTTDAAGHRSVARRVVQVR